MTTQVNNIKNKFFDRVLTTINISGGHTLYIGEKDFKVTTNKRAMIISACGQMYKTRFALTSDKLQSLINYKF